MTFKKESSQEKHQHEILRELQEAVRQDKRTMEILERATRTEERAKENLHQARLALRRVVEGGI